jgi:Flp pilus assembly protein TadD
MAPRAYRQAEVLVPNNGAPHYGLGADYLAMHEPDQAIVELREAVKLDPRTAKFHRELGGALEGKTT